MKFTMGLTILSFISLISSQTLEIQNELVQPLEVGESFLVTFECHSCTKRNKFSISGPDEHTFRTVEFPLQIKLRAGEYEMTYWQNRVQQIHLPFYVGSNSENIITVKD